MHSCYRVGGFHSSYSIFRALPVESRHGLCWGPTGNPQSKQGTGVSLIRRSHPTHRLCRALLAKRSSQRERLVSENVPFVLFCCENWVWKPNKVMFFWHFPRRLWKSLMNGYAPDHEPHLEMQRAFIMAAVWCFLGAFWRALSCFWRTLSKQKGARRTSVAPMASRVWCGWAVLGSLLAPLLDRLSLTCALMC